jgi:putative serine/threonine protein kinase
MDKNSEELAFIISYPHYSDIEYIYRLKEIHSLGITSILLEGDIKIGKMNIAGKGTVGIVLKAQAKSEIYALKVRRTDANRKTMDREAALLKLANSAGIGPKIIKYSNNFIMMEFIDGLTIIDWVMQKNITVEQVLNVVRTILNQCYILDRSHIDHGELNRLDHHVIISKSDAVSIIDFESASIQRKTCNVTAAFQSLFLGGFVSRQVKEILHFIEGEKTISALATYKRHQNKINFENIINNII